VGQSQGPRGQRPRAHPRQRCRPVRSYHQKTITHARSPSA
jgi:hypothetical protein